MFSSQDPIIFCPITSFRIVVLQGPETNIFQNSATGRISVIITNQLFKFRLITCAANKTDESNCISSDTLELLVRSQVSLSGLSTDSTKDIIRPLVD